MINEVDPAANRSTANGATTVFPYTFEISSNTDIEVLVDNSTKAVGTDYTVDGIGNSGGGNVTFLSAPANGTIVTRIRKQPASQLSDYVPNEPVPAERIEADLDKLVMQIQQVREQLHRALLLPKKSSLVDQGMDVPTVGAFARGKSGGGIDWATPTNAGPLSSPVGVVDGGTGATTAAGARANLLLYSENTLIDAKGDLLAGSADNALARVAASATTGLALIADPSATPGVSWSHRAQDNPIINGSMEVWQDGTTFVSIANGEYAAAQWFRRTSGVGTVTLLQATTVPTVAQAGVLFNYSLQSSVGTIDASIAAGDLYATVQRIEGYNWRHFAQRQFTLSFWVRSYKTGVHCVAFRNNSTGTPDRSYVEEYTVNAINTWEYKTITVSASPSAGTWNYTTGAGLEIAFVQAVGSTFHTTPGAWQTGNFYGTASQVNAMDTNSQDFIITGVKLELGSVATPIRFRSFQEELDLCERYFQKSFPYAGTPAQNFGVAAGETTFMSTITGAVALYHDVRFKRSMRIAPTMTYYNPGAANAQARNLNDSLDCSATATSCVTTDNVVISTVGNAGAVPGERIGINWTASARL